MDDNPNTSCLEGMRCPKCGYHDHFLIAIVQTASVYDDGTEGTHGDIYWEDESSCKCGDCDYSATVKEFTE